MSIEAAYIGNKGTNVFAGNGPSYNANQPSMNGYPTVPQAQRRPYFGRFSYPGYIDPATGLTLTCCSGDLGNYLGNDANSHYNAFQAKVEKRFSHGLQFLSHYTYAHAYNYDSNYFADDKRIAYGLDDFNRNQVWVTNLVYDLPFGKGKMFGSNAGRVTDAIIGGWEMTTTANVSSGLPFTPSTSVCGSEQDVGVCRPNKGSGSFSMGAGSFNPITHTQTYFTPVPLGGAFTDPGKGNLGNIGRNTLHGPGLFTEDLSVMKNFRATERVKAQFRMDVFNVFNHPVGGFSSTQGNTCIDCVGTNAGQITALEADVTMRMVQFALRFTF